MSAKQAQVIIDEAAKDPARQARFEAFARDIARIGNDTIVMQARAGDVPSEDVKRMLNYYGEYWFPLHHVDEDETGWFGGKGGKYMNRGPSIKGRSKEGSTRPIRDPIDVLQSKLIEAYRNAATARVSHLLIEKVSTVPGMGGIADKIDPKTKVSRGTLAEILDQLVKSGAVTANKAKSMRIAYGLLNGAKFKPATIAWFAKFHGVSTQGRTPQAVLKDLIRIARSEPDVLTEIAFYRPDYRSDNGKRIVLYRERNGDVSLYQLDELTFEVVQSLRGPEFNVLEKGIGFLATTFKSGTVAYNAAFGVKNLGIDYFTFQGRSQKLGTIESLYKPLVHLFGYAWYRGNKAFGKKVDHPLYDMYDRAGGKLFSRMSYDFAAQRRQQHRRLGTRPVQQSSLFAFHLRNTYDRFSDVLDGIKELIAISDAPCRLAEAEGSIREDGYVRSGDKWKEIKSGNLVSELPEYVRIRALTAAGDATVNFKNVGAVGQRIEPYFPFFNATIQSQYRQLILLANTRNVFSSDKEKRRLAQRYIVFNMALVAAEIAYYAVRHGDDDWDEQENRDKDNYWSWGVNGKTYLWIPKPRDEKVIGNMVRTVFENFDGGRTRSVLGVLVNDLLDRIPTGGGALRAAAETYFNYDVWRDRPLVPVDLQDEPVEDQYTAYTSSLSKKLANMLGYSPIKVEHLLGQSTGGMYKSAADRIDFVREGKYGKAILGRRLSMEPRHQSASVGDFYDKKADAQIEATRAARKGSDDATNKAAEAARLKKFSELMTSIRSAEKKSFDKRTFEYEPYIVGLAREALRYSPQESNPSPFDAPDLPAPVKDALGDYLEGEAKKAFLRDGARVERGEKETEEEFAEKKKRSELAIKDAKEFLDQHKDSEVVKEAVRKVMQGKTFRDVAAGKNKPVFNPKTESVASHMKDMQAWRARQSAAMGAKKLFSK